MFGLLILLTVIELTWRLNQQERTWIRFLQSVNYQDFNQVYQKQKISNDLKEAYELITQSMEALKTSKEAEFKLLETVLGHIPIAVVCFDDVGNVTFANKAFDELLDLPALINIERLDRDFPELYRVMTAPEASPTEWVDHTDGQQLFIKTEPFKLQGKGHQLVSLTDIRNSLDTKELESYQKLMRVMTHEIMNSATPILSLISVVNKKLIHDAELNQLDSKDQRNIAKSLNAIEERTADMLKFVESYKKINRSIAPNITPISSKELIQSITTLMASQSSVTITIRDDFQDFLLIDRALISQVLINLVRNAIDAVEGMSHPTITISLIKDAGWVRIVVEDNGHGIAAHAINQVFVPFYTTKANGSGIGLALSRKIVKAHGGFLEYDRHENKTRLIMRIPNRV